MIIKEGEEIASSSKFIRLKINWNRKWKKNCLKIIHKTNYPNPRSPGSFAIIFVFVTRSWRPSPIAAQISNVNIFLFCHWCLALLAIFISCFTTKYLLVMILSIWKTVSNKYVLRHVQMHIILFIQNLLFNMGSHIPEMKFSF